MRHDQRPEVGTTVHLRPVTRNAGPHCQAYAPAEVVSYQAWPMVSVRVPVEGAGTRTILVHCDNIGLHPAKNKAVGDQAAKIPTQRQPKRMPGRLPEMVLPNGYEEVPLF